MNVPRRWVVRCVAVVALALALWWLIPSEATRIERQVRKMASLASFGPGKGNIRMQTDLQRLTAQFRPDAQIVLEELGRTVPVSIFGPNEIQQLATAGRQFSGGLKVTIHDTDVRLEGPASAVVLFTATAEVGGDRDSMGVQEFEMHMEKAEGQWRVTLLRALPLMGRR